MTSGASGRLNFLLITADQWPGALLGAAGHPTIQTPTLDQLAQDGVRFTHAYSETPVCIPARRTLMTGTPPRLHGDRSHQPSMPMPGLPTLAQSFRDAGYQAYAVGKLHVYPQRDRIGFDDVVLSEEGRSGRGAVDDYEIFLGDQGHVGGQFGHGMSNNDYVHRPWHLPEHLHPTNWAAKEMSRAIRRRDPTRPALWYLSFQHPHPPLTPLDHYLQLYRHLQPRPAATGPWSQVEIDRLPLPLRSNVSRRALPSGISRASVLAAFYALCTHIDHQIRRVIGTLGEEGVLDRTVILFTADHGDMLGDHRLWAKRTFYEGSAHIPMLLLGPSDDPRLGGDQVDTRLVGLQDVMPTLLDIADIPAPSQVQGRSVVSGHARAYMYGELGEREMATRMVHDGRHKLIYYPAGHRIQLFDLEADPGEEVDLAATAEHSGQRDRLLALLRQELYGPDLEWLDGEDLVGLPDEGIRIGDNRQLFGVRGVHWPPPPTSGPPGRALGL